MLAREFEGLLNAHAYLRVERPPTVWTPETELEPFIRLLGEMIAAGLVRSGQELGDITLNVSNVTVEPRAAGPLPEGDFVAITIRSAGDWSPQTSWDPRVGPAPQLVNADLRSAAVAAGVAYGYTRTLADGEGSVTVFLRRV